MLHNVWCDHLSLDNVYAVVLKSFIESEVLQYVLNMLTFSFFLVLYE